MENRNNSDLHIHSIYSNDGEITVPQIAKMCIDHQIDTFSITDHNCVQANRKASEMAATLNLCFLTGIEIDCSFNGTDLHVLGYGINERSSDFEVLEKDISSKVMDSFAAMTHNMERLGMSVDADEVLCKAAGKLPTGELIAEVLLENPKYDYPELSLYRQGGARSDMPYINFYLDFFAQGKPAYVKIDYMGYKDVIELITDNGGTPIIAHPGLNLRGRESWAEQLLDKGAQGLEVFNNYHNEKQMDYFAQLTKQRGLLMTGGSDFHGKTKPLIQVGRYNAIGAHREYLQQSITALKNNTNTNH